MPSMFVPPRLVSIVCLLLTAFVSVSASARNNADFMPRYNGDATAVNSASLAELRELQLVSTNLVSAMVQLQELQPFSVTLQVSPPRTAFGNTIVRALEDAGYGLQWVAADQGKHYVSYSKRFAETDAGPVTDFEIAVGDVSLRREYISNDNGIFPSSVMTIGGTSLAEEIALNDDIFREQGGSGEAFISGVLATDDSSASVALAEVEVNDYDETPENRRTPQQQVLEAARQQYFTRQTLKISQDSTYFDTDRFESLRRTVVIFEDKSSLILGDANKQAVRLMAREFLDTDLFLITACTDVDGRNDAATLRGMRVADEFISHGIAPEAVSLAPCIRASYRHESDNSPVPVEVVQYRERAAL